MPTYTSCTHGDMKDGVDGVEVLEVAAGDDDIQLPPRRSQLTDEILQELGYDKEEIAALRRDGAV